MCKWLALIWNEIMSFSQQQLLKFLGIWYDIFVRFKTKKIVCILVISVISNIFKCYQSRYSRPYFSELTFQDIEDFSMYTFFCFWVILNFFKCQKPHYSCNGLPANFHANFTYSFPTLKIILIPTMTRSNHFWFISLIAHTGPPMPESQFLYVT